MPDVHGSTKPPTATCSPRCASARPISTSTCTSGQGAEQKDEAREKAREEARKKLEEEARRSATARRKPLPEFGSAEDFQLAQAINRLKGKPVLVSKTAVERKAEANDQLSEAGIPARTPVRRTGVRRFCDPRA